MRKINLFTLIALVVILSMLFGCAPKPTEAPIVTEEAVATEAPPVATEAPPVATEEPEAKAEYPPIVVACWSSPEHENLVKDAAVYEEITGNEVIIEEIAREAYFDKLTTTFVGGGSDYDAAYVMSDWIPAWWRRVCSKT